MESATEQALSRLADIVARVSRPAGPGLLVLAGAGLLLPLELCRSALGRRCQELETARALLEERLAESAEALAESWAWEGLKAGDLAAYKEDLSRLTLTRRAAYESGLQLQEEKRLLEKLWEIRNTTLLVDEESRKIHVMRGEQSLESYPFSYVPPQSFGSETREPLWPTVIASKERFAHPERPKSEQVGGELKWEPPQVGASVRANALGEYVMFGKGPLIIHGPPSKPSEHQAFPHVCVGLTLPAARSLYRASHIGTKVAFKAVSPLAPRIK